MWTARPLDSTALVRYKPALMAFHQRIGKRRLDEGPPAALASPAYAPALDRHCSAATRKGRPSAAFLYSITSSALASSCAEPRGLVPLHSNYDSLTPGSGEASRG
jgi:hypothetical protein